MKKTCLFLLAAIFAFAMIAGCAQQADTSEDTSLATIQENGKIVMGLDDSFPPMGFKDENGELTGFDVELAKAVADKMGVELELMPIDWSAKEMELDAGNVDILWNGYTITDERKEKVLMSDPYMKNEQVIVVTEDSPITTLADLTGKKVAVQDGSSAQEAIAANEELQQGIAEQIDFKDNVTAMMDVSSGQVDALAVDSVVADYYLAQHPGEYRILEETLAPEEYGIGFRKGEESFKNAVMDALKELKEEGTAAEISEKWFGRDVTTF